MDPTARMNAHKSTSHQNATKDQSTPYTSRKNSRIHDQKPTNISLWITRPLRTISVTSTFTKDQKPSRAPSKPKQTTGTQPQNYSNLIVDSEFLPGLRKLKSRSTKPTTIKVYISQRNKQSATVALAGDVLLYPPTLGDSPSGFSDLRSHAPLCLASKN